MDNFFLVTDDFDTIIKRCFSDEVKKIDRVLNGWTNFVFKVTLISNEEYYFRFPRNKFFSKALLSEVKYTNYIKDKITYKTADLELKYDNSRPFTMHKVISGKNLYQVLDILPKEKIKPLCDDICKFIMELQMIDIKLVEELRSLSDFLKELADISHTDYDYDFSMHDTLIKEESYKAVLNHGDLNPGNIIVDENFKVKAILDFAFCTKSSQTEDLSRIIGRLPDEYYEIMVNSYENIFKIKIDKNTLDNLIKMWRYVDNNYVNYMKKNCPDVVIPDNL